jgi:hypothetical protein
MNIVKKTVLFGAFLLSMTAEAQKATHDEGIIEKHSVSGNILGSSSLVGVTYERVLSNSFIFEVGFGFVGLGTGITFYPLKIKKSNVCPYTGVKFSFLVLPEVFGAYGGYIPFGLTFFSKHRLNIGLDFGPAFGHWFKGGGRPAIYDPTIDYNDSGNLKVYGNLKIGFRF